MPKYQSKVESKSTANHMLTADEVANNLEKITLEVPKAGSANGQPGITFKTARFMYGDRTLTWRSTEVSTFPVKMPTNQAYQSKTPSTQVTWDWEKNQADLTILMYAGLLAAKTVEKSKNKIPTEFEPLKEAYLEKFPVKVNDDDDDDNSGNLRAPIFTFYADKKQAEISISKFSLYESKQDGTRTSMYILKESGGSVPISWEDLIGRRANGVMTMNSRDLFLGRAAKCLRLSSRGMMITELFERNSMEEVTRKGLEEEATRQNLGGMSEEALAAVLGNLGRSEVVSAQTPSKSPQKPAANKSLDQGHLVSDDDDEIDAVLAGLNDDDEPTPAEELMGSKSKSRTKRR